MFVRQRDPGLWTFDSVVTGAEFEYWDASIANAIDGTGGGAYSLNSVITIGGAPGIYWQFDLGVFCTDSLGVQGVFEAFGPVGMYGNVTIGSGPGDLLSVQCPAIFDGDLTVHGFTELIDATFDGEVTHNGDVFYNNPADFGSNVTFHDGTVTIGASGADAFTVNAFATHNGTGIHNGAEYFYGGAEIASALSFSGTGAIRHRHTTGANANASYSPLAVHEVIVIDGSLSGPVVYTIDDTGCVDTNEIIFSNKDQSNTMQVKRPDGSSLGANSGHWYRCKRVGGTWQIVQEGTLRA